MVTKNKIALLPDSPGVYMFKDAAGKIIYIGKAKSLKKRVQSYFNRPLDTKTQAMTASINDIAYHLTNSEPMALILEAALVHRIKPRYNVLLRDDKSFPFVKITDEDFPRLCVVRKKDREPGQYIGPYTSAKLLRQALGVIRRTFPYRSCRAMPKKACMYYRIGLSPAPCIGKISKAEYARTIKKITLILEGRAQELINELTGEMNLKSRNKEFEAAAKLRDQISAISSLSAARAGFDASAEAEDLGQLLRLRNAPLRIEAFDVSNIFGAEACGSMVSFFKGRPDKDNYRRFRIKGVSGINDYAMIREVVHRRYSRLIAEKKTLPDLILVDGGKAHLAVAKRELKELGLHVPLVSIAKEEENIYVPNQEAPIKLSVDTPALNLIRRIRDEAHRFAVSYHHLLRRKKIIGR